MQYTITIPLKAYFPRNPELGLLEECLERYFNTIDVEPMPSNLPAKQTPLRRFYQLEYNTFLDYDEEDDRKFINQTGCCSVDLIYYLERFNRDLVLLKPYYIRYKGNPHRDFYKPRLLKLFSKVDVHTLKRLKNW